MAPSEIPNLFMIHIIRLNHAGLHNATSKMCRWRPVYHTPPRKIRSEGEGKLVYTLLTKATLSLQQKGKLYAGCSFTAIIHATPTEDLSASTHLKQLQKGACRTLAEHSLKEQTFPSQLGAAHSPSDSAVLCFKLAVSEGPDCSLKAQQCISLVNTQMCLLEGEEFCVHSPAFTRCFSLPWLHRPNLLLYSRVLLESTVISTSCNWKVKIGRGSILVKSGTAQKQNNQVTSICFNAIAASLLIGY